jgi:hypothetical protein
MQTSKAYIVDKYGRIQGPHGDPISVPDDAGIHFICDILNNEYEEAKRLRKYAPPMIVRFNHQAWEDGDYVVTLDGEPVGGAVTPDEAKAIVRWAATAWAEMIEHNTMKHRNKPATQSGFDALGNAVLQAADLPPSPKDRTE